MSNRSKMPTGGSPKTVEAQSPLTDMRRISELRDDELDDELRAAGIDPEEATVLASALFDKTARGESRQNSALESRAPGLGRPVWLMGAVVAVAALVLLASR